MWLLLVSKCTWMHVLPRITVLRPSVEMEMRGLELQDPGNVEYGVGLGSLGGPGQVGTEGNASN